MKIEIGIINGVGGKALIINRIRVAGPKPLGGGRIVDTFWVEEKAILEAIGHKPLPDADKLRDEIANLDLPLRNKLVFLLADAITSDPPLTCYDVSNSILSLLAPEIEKARKGLIAVKDLIDNSYGVVGLHLNGDPAPWESLLEGGQFEDWLKDFSEAISAASATEWKSILYIAMSLSSDGKP